MDTCVAPVYRSTFRYVGGFTGQYQTITIPFSTFQGARMNAVAAFLWATYDFYSDKNFVWQLADVKLLCEHASRSGEEI
ncbi:hypothetical protein GGS26DRAFT_576213 [Hypomontagnella submonticulosa]|nr:hypothetical protein GGS26DRAFT_576213 [Hypomontagnella submonticulosa]